MDLVNLCKRNRDGSYGTQSNRKRGLTAMANELVDLGYALPSARSLKPKHVHALIERWQVNDITTETIRNRLSWLRWWAEKVGKASVIPRDNEAFSLEQKSDGKRNRAQSLDTTRLNAITCNYVKASVLIQQAFGLRREEAIKFNPARAIKAERIEIKGSWTKGGRARCVPISSDYQRQVLALALKIAKKGALIPNDKTFIQHLKFYEAETLRVGMRNTHGLRHAWAQRRYHQLTDIKCPYAGGPRWQNMNDQQRKRDRDARRQISREMGHTRLAIVDTYIGRAMS